jgi:hypothetical protein
MPTNFGCCDRAMRSSTVARAPRRRSSGGCRRPRRRGHGPRRWRAPRAPAADGCRSSPCGARRRPRHRSTISARSVVEIGEVQVAMAVDDLGGLLGHGVSYRLGPVSGACGGQGSGGGHGQPLRGPVEVEEHIEDERGRVKIDRLAAPCPAVRSAASSAQARRGGGIRGRREGRHPRRERWARASPRSRPSRQPRQQPVEQCQRQVEARLRPARAGGIREFQRRRAVHVRQAGHQAARGPGRAPRHPAPPVAPPRRPIHRQ